MVHLLLGDSISYKVNPNNLRIMKMLNNSSWRRRKKRARKANIKIAFPSKFFRPLFCKQWNWHNAEKKEEKMKPGSRICIFVVDQILWQQILPSKTINHLFYGFTQAISIPKEEKKNQRMWQNEAQKHPHKPK